MAFSHQMEELIKTTCGSTKVLTTLSGIGVSSKAATLIHGHVLAPPMTIIQTTKTLNVGNLLLVVRSEEL